MIIHGLGMQGRRDEIPKEVVAFLLERDSLYPNIDFIVDCWEPHPSQVEETEKAARKYSRSYQLVYPNGGVLLVAFWYLKQKWSVRIVGGVDEGGNIADREKRDSVRSLTREFRNEIAGIPANVEKLNDIIFAVPRAEGEIVPEKPVDMIMLPPDFHWTSEVSMSGEELGNILSNPKIKKEAEHAIWKKDWEKLKHLGNIG